MVADLGLTAGRTAGTVGLDRDFLVCDPPEQPTLIRPARRPAAARIRTVDRPRTMAP
jgi:hypothetical protein